MNELEELFKMKKLSDKFELVEQLIFTPQFRMIIMNSGLGNDSKQNKDKFQRNCEKVVGIINGTKYTAQILHNVIMQVMMAQVDTMVKPEEHKDNDYQPEVG